MAAAYPFAHKRFKVPNPPPLLVSCPHKQELTSYYANLGEQWWAYKNRDRYCRLKRPIRNRRQPLSLRILTVEAIRKQRFIAYYVRNSIFKFFKTGNLEPGFNSPRVFPFNTLLTEARIIYEIREMIFTDKFGQLETSQIICSIPEKMEVDPERLLDLEKRCREAWEKRVAVYYNRPQRNKNGFQPRCLRFLAAQKVKEQIFVASRVRYLLINDLLYFANSSCRIQMESFILSYRFYSREDRICRMNVEQVIQWVFRSLRNGSIELET